jgi:hypothetical protein
MSNENENKKPKQEMSNVVEMPKRCPVCGGKEARAGFCAEHFMWFKEGLINRKGEKPSDFDKKYQSFMRKQAA